MLFKILKKIEFRFYGLNFRIYKPLLNYLNKHLNKSLKLFFKCYKIIRFYVILFFGSSFFVFVLWFNACNTLLNAFNKHLNKSYKTLFKML